MNNILLLLFCTESKLEKWYRTAESVIEVKIINGKIVKNTAWNNTE